MKILPVEVKSGTNGKMKSLRVFMRKKHITNAIRTSLENFGRINYTDSGDHNTVRQISICPLYALSKLTNPNYHL